MSFEKEAMNKILKVSRDFGKSTRAGPKIRRIF